jgi:hypothetical protein
MFDMKPILLFAGLDKKPKVTSVSYLDLRMSRLPTLQKAAVCDETYAQVVDFFSLKRRGGCAVRSWMV